MDERTVDYIANIADQILDIVDPGAKMPSREEIRAFQLDFHNALLASGNPLLAKMGQLMHDRLTFAMTTPEAMHEYCMKYLDSIAEGFFIATTAELLSNKLEELGEFVQKMTNYRMDLRDLETINDTPTVPES